MLQCEPCIALWWTPSDGGRRSGQTSISRAASQIWSGRSASKMLRSTTSSASRRRAWYGDPTRFRACSQPPTSGCFTSRTLTDDVRGAGLQDPGGRTCRRGTPPSPSLGHLRREGSLDHAWRTGSPRRLPTACPCHDAIPSWPREERRDSDRRTRAISTTRSRSTTAGTASLSPGASVRLSVRRKTARSRCRTWHLGRGPPRPEPA